MNTVPTNGQIFSVFSFHISRLDLASAEQQAMNHLLSMCMVRCLDFEVQHSRISSFDMAVRIYVFDAPADILDLFYLYQLRPVY